MWVSMPSKKFLKKVKKRVPWIEHVITDLSSALDLNYDVGDLKARIPEGSLCLACRGSKMLCGKARCPIIVKLYSYIKAKPLYDSTELEGSSPPGVFIGRIGYPYVYAGPLVPPVQGDTSLYDFPELWLGRSIEEIVDFRIKLIRGKFKVNVKKVEEAGRLMDLTREMALSLSPVDTEVTFKNKPSGSLLLDDDVQPIGPSAQLKDMLINEVKADHRMEKAYGDIDLKASEAVLSLHMDHVPVSRIQRAFSVGAFGLKGQRRLVPTRWSITAIDSMISRALINDVIKKSPIINEYKVYESNYLDNRFIILMLPSAWSYEAIEAWHPGTTWNPASENIAICGDWEGYKGRRNYASIGGCYYAARLAVAEKLAEDGRQATALVLRESYPGYIMPVGVWQVRENVRNALRQSPRKFSEFKEALDYISQKFQIKLKVWIESSKIISDALHQEKLTKYII